MAAGEGFAFLRKSHGGCDMPPAYRQEPPFESFSPATKKIITPVGVMIFLAAGEGFEPSQTESESGVLPLHKPAICFKHILLYAPFGICQEVFSCPRNFFLKVSAGFRSYIPRNGTGPCPRSASARWRSRASFPWCSDSGRICLPSVPYN